MNYLDEFKKFISSYQLSAGIRITLGAVLPSLILQHYNLLSEYIAFPLGTLLLGATDSPGPYARRRNALLIAIGTYFLVALVTDLLRDYPFIIFVEIIFFGVFFSLAGVYGNRANNIGLIALLVFVFNIDDHLSRDLGLRTVLIFSLGGLWYFILFLVLQKLRPYVLIRQLLGENFVELGKLLSIKSGYYATKPKYEELFSQMVHQQVILRENHQNLREILFKTREFVNESNTTSRTLMLMFLDSIDLFERILNSQQDYHHLHEAFEETKILRLFGTYLRWLSEEIQQIGIAVQSGTPSKPKHNLDLAFNKCARSFDSLRERRMDHENIEDFIMLRQILNRMQDITERIKKLHRATSFDSKLGQTLDVNVNLENFIPKQDYHPRILLDNLSLKSAHFRHAIRVTLALLIAYLISITFEFGHGYWVLLTIVTIMKPAFSLTKQRNIYRIGGTFTGLIIGFGLLYFVQDGTALFLVLMFSMITAYTFLKVNYFIASTSITLYVILCFYFIHPDNLHGVLQDRAVDTALGSLIAFVVSYYVLPLWEYAQINQYLKGALLANRAYFDIVSLRYTGQHVEIGRVKEERKNAIIAMANLSDNFEKMLSEPKRQQPHMEEYHQFVATSHMLTSYVASLSFYMETTDFDDFKSEFEAMIRQIDRQFEVAVNILEGRTVDPIDLTREALPQNQKLVQLLANRKKEVRELGITHSAQGTDRKRISDLMTINGLFELISTITIDEIKILQVIMKNNTGHN
ncbi:putative membrane protein YccC [Dyadobacter jejuensis]|uniref:Putative membrane protein YccC n=1 Tax=Dyadobacter jejuensis TaxID=1082580 RepID=A0A316AI67_9BACT|nr:FUSC family membrane protein [Dyadobacter jejuensis]PWJ57445.1 putative membrane protein YccC [Dyadobacter jejuensis]